MLIVESSGLSYPEIVIDPTELPQGYHEMARFIIDASEGSGAHPKCAIVIGIDGLSILKAGYSSHRTATYGFTAEHFLEDAKAIDDTGAYPIGSPIGYAHQWKLPTIVVCDRDKFMKPNTKLQQYWPLARGSTFPDAVSTVIYLPGENKLMTDKINTVLSNRAVTMITLAL